MVEVVIYTKDYCYYCKKAKALLNEKGVKFKEIDVTYDQEKEKEMIEKSGRVTVPEIFINGKLVGGCDDLFELEDRGKLDKLLN